ncbi:MAG: hypothetical protein J6330_03480, partial [Clostridia bacterium]|nr:hypothetical protein [Clostridia bacterium]
MNKETDLKEIESMLSALYSGLLSAAPAVDATDRSKMIKNNKKNAVPVFRRPVVQFAAAICAALIVGVATYALLMKLNNRNDPVSPLTDNSADQTESGPDNDTTDVTVVITTDSAESPDTETQTGTETTADVTVAPETSDPETTAPETTVPETTV